MAASAGAREIKWGDKTLTKNGEVSGGKNKDDEAKREETISGFYRDLDGKEYFIKKPKDPKELFTELFAGKILEQFLEHKILDEKLRPSLIYADAIRLPDGTYGLIQPRREFTELFKHIDEVAGRAAAKDRNPLQDMIAGRREYKEALDKIQHENLAIFLVLSIILGDYSVHSGNTVLLEEKKVELPSVEVTALGDSFVLTGAAIFQVARIDWGAAFRLFADPRNADILWPAEYTGIDIFKLFTKNYLQLYADVPNLFDRDIPSAGINLRAKLGEGDVGRRKLTEIMLAAVRAIPPDLMSEDVRAEVARYMCIPVFLDACKATSNVAPDSGKSPNQLFAEKMAETMFPRIEAVAALSKKQRLELERAALRTLAEEKEAEYKAGLDAANKRADERIRELEAQAKRLTDQHAANVREEKEKAEKEKQEALEEQRTRLNIEYEAKLTQALKSQSDRLLASKEITTVADHQTVEEAKITTNQFSLEQFEELKQASCKSGVFFTLSAVTGASAVIIGVLDYSGKIDTTTIFLMSKEAVVLITVVAIICGVLAIYYRNKALESARFFQPAEVEKLSSPPTQPNSAPVVSASTTF